MRIKLYTGILACTLFFSFCKSKKEAQGTASSQPGTLSSATAGASDNMEGLNLGNMAPEIALKNPKDSLIKLSSLRGNIVLIDFWASWCGPCRRDNPAVVSVYNKFKNQKFNNAKAFTIYSVSLDHTKAKWEEAIAVDQLSWPYHVSDLMGWNNAAATKYSVQGIPFNYLIDANGIIIAKNLKGNDLAKTLERLVVKQ